MKWVLALAIGLGLTGRAQAATTDSLTVTITPNAYYDVDITTYSSALMNLGLVNLAASTWTVRPATVTINSTYAATDLKLQGQINTSGGTAWQFDSDTSNANLDRLQSWAVFTDTGVAAAPSQTSGYFSGTTPGVSNSDVISTTNEDVGTAGSDTGMFEAAAADAGFKDMDNLTSSLVDAPASASHLWLRFKLPNATTSSTAQDITITLTAGAPVP